MPFSLACQVVQGLPRRSGEDESGNAAILDPIRQDIAKLSHVQRILWLASPDVFSTTSNAVTEPGSDKQVPSQFKQILDDHLREYYIAVYALQQLLISSPYSFHLHAFIAELYYDIGYPDLAAGSAYKSILLYDAIADDSDEYHEHALEAADNTRAQWDQAGLAQSTTTDAEYQRALLGLILAQSLLHCGCLRSAHFYCLQSVKQFPEDLDFKQLLNNICAAAAIFYHNRDEDVKDHNHTVWPDTGMVRREKYLWNEYEPDRLNALDHLNQMMCDVAPKLEVKAVRLPALTSVSNDDHMAESVQLGVFAREDLEPGEAVLTEVSLLTANNKLQEALCDACSVELPDLGATDTVACDDCQVVFCSQTCHDLAQHAYHPALCDREVEAIAKDGPLAEASDSLYSLLLLRSIAMAATQECHPLELPEVKYIWGDFNDIDYATATANSALEQPAKTLPFSFKYNITLPLHMLEKMDIDVFLPQYDTWVLNTLYSKYRGTASARLSGLGGRAIRGPEVCAVHPMWCLANHSCDPNVSWRWGGEITFRIREQRAEWQGRNKSFHNKAGIKKGQEILNHYCDIDLPVQQRREWARGALGGDCMCERCIWETQQQLGV